MNRIVTFSSLLLVLFCLDTAKAARLGDPAGNLQIRQWVKGNPFQLQTGNIYVVEFWATWCGPCRKSIPHLTELQRKYSERGVTFIGITVEDMQTVRPFVNEMGNKMNYWVAIDSNRRTHAAYMKAYGRDGIPAAFVVDKNKKVAWVGHPMGELDSVLQAMTATASDLNAFQKPQERVYKNPQLKKYFDLAKKGAAGEAGKLGQNIVDANSENPETLNLLAWDILTLPDLRTRDLDLALNAAKAAYFATKGQNAAVLDTYARAHYMKGNVNSAIRFQNKAIGASRNSGEILQMRTTLKAYENRETKLRRQRTF